MKIPKKLKLFGYDWKIKIDPKEVGGEFTWKTKTITVGNLYGEQESVFIHEVMEAILCELQFRFYGQEKSMEYQFYFNHTGLVKFHKAFFQALKDNKLI